MTRLSTGSVDSWPGRVTKISSPELDIVRFRRRSDGVVSPCTSSRSLTFFKAEPIPEAADFPQWLRLFTERIYEASSTMSFRAL